MLCSAARDIGLNGIRAAQGPLLAVQLFNSCSLTPSTMVCSEFTATCFLRSRFMAVTAWTPSWFGRQVSTMGPSWCRQIQFGMHRFYSFSQPQRRTTQGPKRLNVHSCQRWKHTTTLNMVIIVIIVTIDIIVMCSLFCLLIVIIVINVLIVLIGII